LFSHRHLAGGGDFSGGRSSSVADQVVIVWKSRVFKSSLTVATVTFLASSAESMGAFWLGELTEIGEESQFRDFRRPKSVRLSRHQSYLVIEALDSPRAYAPRFSGI
jgi:hypothetical protein